MATPVRTRAQVGMDAPSVMVEAHFRSGSAAFALVGLPETAVREARERVQAAIRNVGLSWPEGKIIVNLAPGDLAKQGSRYDLAIAIAVLATTGQIEEAHLDAVEFLGELSLYGDVRPVRGVFCAAAAVAASGRALILPERQVAELAPLDDIALHPIRDLRDVVALLLGATLPRPRKPPRPERGTRRTASLNDVRGQARAKRALAIAAAGGHHVLMTGPPGTGKTMLARRLVDLLPVPSRDEAIEIANIHSISGQRAPAFGVRPFCDPHHTASSAAMIGGGGGIALTPGEISLAHRGVLFLDELPEFRRDVLEALREPLESDEIVLARVGHRARFPAAFQLVAAMNPCPAGLVCDDTRCRCTPHQVRQYLSRLSGPLLDRIDLRVEVGAVPEAELWDGDALQIDDDELRDRVAAARQRQLDRAGKTNAALGAEELDRYCALDDDATGILKTAARRFALSVRAIHRTRRVARTIADLGGDGAIASAQVAEALGYRALEVASA